MWCNDFLRRPQAHTEQTLEAMNQTCNGNETIRDPNVTRTLEQVMSLKSKIEEIQISLKNTNTILTLLT